MAGKAGTAEDRQLVATTAGAHLRGRRVRDTGPEVALRKAVHQAGLRFRLHRKVAPRCTADFVLPRHHVAVFVDGCFWHGCPVRGASVFRGPNADRWAAKITANKERDRRNTEAAEAAGWTVLRVWECEVRKDPVTAALRILAQCAAARGPRTGPAPKGGPRSR
ncbi:very short patch repair endonuclease [Streptomyces rochei]|uniref:very short patch repair endonuclease n=1 Tax=Streptomyces rochei TaxID=1928 RepID=UPI0036BE021D